MVSTAVFLAELLTEKREFEIIDTAAVRHSEGEFIHCRQLLYPFCAMLRL
jgi:hypothetical protein